MFYRVGAPPRCFRVLISLACIVLLPLALRLSAHHAPRVTQAVVRPGGVPAWLGPHAATAFMGEHDVLVLANSPPDCADSSRDDAGVGRDGAPRRGASELVVVFAGLAHNVAGVLPEITAHVESSGELFRNYSVFVYENDSFDGTAAQLGAWRASNPRVRFLSEQLRRASATSDRETRTPRMAEYRNRLLDFTRAHDALASADAVVMLDFDLPCCWSVRALAHSVERAVNKDGAHGHFPHLVCALGTFLVAKTNQVVYYDTFAHRESALPVGPNDFAPFVPAQLRSSERQRNSVLWGLYDSYRG